MKQLLATLLAFFTCIAPTLYSADSRKPNIILIVADDLGWRDLGSYGSEVYQTPHLDQLAKNGVRFSNAYAASPLCSPTRASLLTGQSPARHHFTTPTGHLPNVVLDPKEKTVSDPGLPMAEPQTRTRLPLAIPTVAKTLKNNGYTNGFMGKWHLGFAPYIPENFGFDTVVCGRGFPGPPPPGFFGPWDPERTNMPQVEGSPHADDVLGDEASRFIEENKSEPFFLALWFFGVHAPYQAKPELIEKYRPLVADAQHQKSAIMGGMVETVDDNVGKVMQTLQRLGLDENTLVIFTSDNGGNMYDRPEGVNPTSNHPLKAGKGSNYEGGSRVPFIASWPNHIQPDTTNETLAISHDIFPTLAAVAKTEMPANHIIDGVNLLPALKGETLERPAIYSLFAHTVLATGNVANAWIRENDWKAFRFYNADANQEDYFELYNLADDIGETRNLAASNPAKLTSLIGQLDDYLEDAQALLANKNQNYNPKLENKGLSMISGGLMYSSPPKVPVRITVKGPGLTLGYRLPADQPKPQALRLQLKTNCLTGVVAADAGTSFYGKPVALTPDFMSQTIDIPLDLAEDAENITLSFELSQPGRVFIEDASLVH